MNTNIPPNATNPTPPFEKDGMDIKKLLPLLEILSGMYKKQPGTQFGSSLHNDDMPVPKNSFDDAVNTEEMKILNSAIPYLDFKISRQMALFLKIIELRNTINYFNDPSNELIREEKDPNIKKKMLLAMRPHLSDDRKTLIDYAIKALDMRDLANSFDTPNTSSSLNEKEASESTATSGTKDLNSTLTEMLTPEQQEMFNTFNGIMRYRQFCQDK